jgi:hypothetical protein
LRNGAVLIAGGFTNSGALSSADLFGPSTGSFTAVRRSMTTARERAVAAPLRDGDVLIAGGSNSHHTLTPVVLLRSQANRTITRKTRTNSRTLTLPFTVQ